MAKYTDNEKGITIFTRIQSNKYFNKKTTLKALRDILSYHKKIRNKKAGSEEKAYEQGYINALKNVIESMEYWPCDEVDEVVIK